MRAVVCEELGPPEALVVRERPDPEPGPGEVRVAVRAAGVNYVDGLICAGRYQIRIPPPFTPGSEVAGEIDAVGDGVTGLAPGDRVFATLGTGGFAERVVARAGQVVPVPGGLDFPRLASFHQAYATAWFAFTRRAPLAAGQTVLVLGGAGGIGLAAIDAARALGARVIAAASSPEKLALCERMGAAATIDYAREDLKARARECSDGGVDVVYDPVGGDYSEAAFRALGDEGRFLVVGFTAGIPRLPLNLVLLRNRHVVGVEWGAWAMRNPAEDRSMLLELLGMIEAGRLHPVEPHVRALTDAPAVIADLLERRASGKTVLVP